MSQILLRTLERLDPRDLRRVVTGYESTHGYNVRRSESRARVIFRLERTPLARPFMKRFSRPRGEWDRYLEVIREGCSLGAYDGDHLVGLALAETRGWNRTLWVWEIGVAKSHRRKRIGTRLVRELSRRARSSGLRAIVCETQTTNAPAIEFYRRNGFVVDGIDLSYYTSRDVARGEIALFMKKHLRPRRLPRGRERHRGRSRAAE